MPQKHDILNSVKTKLISLKDRIYWKLIHLGVIKRKMRGYMCKVSWDYEAGEASDGTRFYGSLQDLINHAKHCAQECGVVEIEIKYVKTVIEERFWQ